MTELLAPAGSAEAAHAAIEYGADAIYLGLPRFSARAEAINFTEDEFFDIVGYAHACNTRVYVTLNTLVKEDEIDPLLSMMHIIEQAGADAAIVQDLGILRLLKEYFPAIRLHASTQMAIHNKPGAEYLLNMGVKRVTLARELSISEISEIAAIPDMETESFLHGALCYSYSGLCMYSSMQTGRSANRGRCAYSCRELFSCPELDLSGHAFSLRDLSLVTHIDSLLASGVDSLKIEGRKKSAQYVAAVVRLYRGLIDKRDSSDEIARHITDLKTIFSRESTSFFADGLSSRSGRTESIDTKAVGHRGAIIGCVEEISIESGNERLTFHASEAVEKHDGIQIDIPGQQRPFGFPVNELFIHTEDQTTKSVFAADKESRICITLPADHPALPAGAPVYLASSQRVKRELKWHTPKTGEHRRRYPVSISMTISPSELHITGLIRESSTIPGPVKHVITYQHDETFSTAKNPDQTPGAVRKTFNKTGKTPFTLDDIEVADASSLFIPASLLNKLRRELYEELSIKLEDQFTAHLSSIQESITRESNIISNQINPEWILKTDAPLSLLHIAPELAERFRHIIIELNDNTNPELLLEEIRQLDKVFSNARVRLALPAICRNSRIASLKTTVSAIVQSGDYSWQISNLWGLEILNKHDIDDVSAASSLYSLNHQSIDQQQALGLSWSTIGIEDEAENIRELLRLRADRLCLTVYQDTPLFIGEACSYSSFNNGCKEDCNEINNHRKWRDTKGNSAILYKHGCRSILINEIPFSLSGHLRELEPFKPAFYEIDFINRYYTTGEINNILSSIFSDGIIPSTHPGNFLRTLQ